MDRLRALEIFKAVADEGSFVKAAGAMNISCAAVTRAVRELERLLGVRLVQRTTRQIALTSAGRGVLDRAVAMLLQYEDLASTASFNSSDLAGEIRLAAPVWYGRRHIGPALASFRFKYPRIHVEVVLTEGAINLLDGRLDMAFSVRSDLLASMIARPVAAVSVGAYASPTYLGVRGTPMHPAELADHDCLVYEGIRNGPSYRFMNPAIVRPVEVQPRGVIASNSAEALIGAATSGAGVLLVPTSLVDHAASNGELRPLLQQWTIEPPDLFLAYPSRHGQSQRVRKLIEHFLQELAVNPLTARASIGRTQSAEPLGTARWPAELRQVDVAA